MEDDQEGSDRLRAAARGAALLVALVAAAALAGWLLGSEGLKRVLPGRSAMNPTTAAGLLLLACALWPLASPRARPGAVRLAGALGLAAAALGGARTLSYLSGAESAIDRLLVPAGMAGSVGAMERMALSTAVCFVLLGGATALRALGRGAGPSLGLVPAFGAHVLAAVVLVGYAFGAEPGMSVRFFTPMALHTAAGFVLLGAGLLLSAPEEGLVAALRSQGAGGELARRLVPSALLLILGLGLAVLWGQRAGLYAPAFAVSVLAATSAAALAWLTGRVAGQLDAAEAGRRRSEAERDRFLELAPDLLCVAGFDGYFKRLNPAWERVLGHAREELLARPYLDFVHPDDLEATLRESAGIARGVETLRFENRYRCRDGSYKWLVWAAVPVVAEGLIYAAARDITQEREERLAQSRLAAIVSASEDAIWAESLDGTVTTWNHGAERLFGWSESEMVGGSSARLLAPGRADESRALVERIARGEGVEPYEAERATREGRLIHAFMTLSPILGEGGKVVGVSKIARDITERRRISQEMAESLREKEVLLREVHHRVKNNLQIVSSFLSLEAAGVGDEKTAAHLLESQGRVKAMALLHEKLYRSKDLANLDFGDYLRGLSEDLAGTYLRGRGRVAIEVQAESVPLDLDTAVPLGLLVNELVSNALKHAFPGGRSGRVRLTLGGRAGGWDLAVEDDGVGLPEAGAGGRSGSLGLRIVEGLCGQLGAALEVTGGSGTRFRVVRTAPDKEEACRASA